MEVKTIVPIVLGKMLLERKLCYNDPENFFTHSSLKLFEKFFKKEIKEKKKVTIQ